MTPRELTDEAAYEQLVRDEVDPAKTLTAVQMSILTSDTRRWHQTLVTLIQQIEPTLSARRAALLEMKRENAAVYLKQKIDFSRFYAAQGSLKTRMLERVRQLKAHHKERNIATSQANYALNARKYYAVLKEAQELVPFEDGPAMDWHVRVAALLHEFRSNENGGADAV